MEQLPNYDELLERIKEISVIGQTETLQGDFYNSNRDKNFNVEEGDLPDFLKDESDVVVVDWLTYNLNKNMYCHCNAYFFLICKN